MIEISALQISLAQPGMFPIQPTQIKAAQVSALTGGGTARGGSFGRRHLGTSKQAYHYEANCDNSGKSHFETESSIATTLSLPTRRVKVPKRGPRSWPRMT